ncbi:MAG: hypothetical protein M9899_02675 [Bdellovibrionaceae bacterium]|nr:hypothetical protein [Pseudobdellovibrionaceae bacterium]
MILLFRALQVLGVALLLAPVIYTLGLITSITDFEITAVIKDFTYVFLQAAISATFGLALGLVSALSLVARPQSARWHLYLGVIPQFLPSLLMIFAYVKALSFFNVFPQSYAHVIVVHILINVGLSSFLLFMPLQKALYRKLHLFAGLNLSKFKYLQLLCGGELKVSLLYVWVLIFSYCLTSFSIPLILSGEGLATSTEYLIYKKGFIEGNWSAAAFWGIVQILFVAFLFKSSTVRAYGKDKAFLGMYQIKWPFHYLGSVASVMLLLTLMMWPVAQMDVALEHLSVDAYDIAVNTLLLAGWSLLFYSLYFWSQVVWVWNKIPWYFYQKFWSLSPILMGVYLLSVSSKFNLDAAGRMILTALVLASFIFPFTFKFWIWPKFNELQKMKIKFDVLGVSQKRAINLVIIDFFKREFMLSLSYVFLFVIGDFAISSILLSDTVTLGLSIKNYIFKYQLAEAQMLSVVLAIVAFISLAIFGGKRAFDSKF